MTDRRPFRALPLAFALLAVSACGTQDIDPANVVISEGPLGPNQGLFMISYASTAETYEAEQARLTMNWDPPLYNVTMDGRLIAEEEGTAGSPVPQLLPISVSEDGLAAAGLDDGWHHFTVVAHGRAPIFQGDGQIISGGWLRLFLFGAADAQQGRFAFIPSFPAPGNEHVTVINLMRSGQVIEVVTCTDATTCTPISPALAMGDLFDTEVPAVVSADGFSSRTADGAGVGFRLVPSAALPDPPVLALSVGASGVAVTGPSAPQPLFIAAPFFMSSQGNILAGFN